MSRTYLAFYYYLFRTYLALSDISCVLLSFSSDKSSSVGHILRFFCHLCRTYLALSDISCVFLSFLSDKSSSVGHILRFFVISVGHI